MAKKIHSLFIKPEIIFLIIGFMAGIPLSIFIPYGAGFDEESHLVRIYDLSRGNLIPNRPNDKGIAFIEFYSLSYKRRYLETPADNLFDTENFFLTADRYNATDAQNHSTYSPFVFLLEAGIALFSWNVLNLPILPVIILMRIAGLCLYLFLGYFTIRKIPGGKWLMTVLLLAPMAIYQASTLNGDRFTIAAAFFFIAIVLMEFAKKGSINLKETLLLILASLLVGVSKPGTIVVFPLLFILIGHRYEKKSYPWLLFGGVLISILYSIGWSELAVLDTTVQSTGTTRAYQMGLILQNLPDFLRVYFVGVINLIPKYFTDWVAEYGYWLGTVPRPVYVLFPISLLLAYFAEGKAEFLNKRTRWIIFLTGVFCLGLMASVKFIFAYVPGQLYFGSQGRYFLPFAPLVFLAFIGLIEVPLKWRKTASISTIIFILATLGLYGYGIYRTYYTTCIFAVDANHPCTLPVYINLDTENPVNVDLKASSLFEQSFDPECGPVDSIDVYVLDISGELNGYVKLKFYDPDHTLLAESEVPLSDLRIGQMNQFKFSPVAVVGSQKYSFTLELTEDSPATVAFWGVAQDKYSKGELLIDGTTSDVAADLYLKFECQR